MKNKNTYYTCYELFWTQMMLRFPHKDKKVQFLSANFIDEHLSPHLSWINTQWNKAR